MCKKKDSVVEQKQNQIQHSHCNVQHICNTFLSLFRWATFSAEWQDAEMGRSQCHRVWIAVAKHNIVEAPIGEGLPKLQQKWLNSMSPFIGASGETTIRQLKKGRSNQDSWPIGNGHTVFFWVSETHTKSHILSHSWKGKETLLYFKSVWRKCHLILNSSFLRCGKQLVNTKVDFLSYICLTSILDQVCHHMVTQI